MATGGVGETGNLNSAFEEPMASAVGSLPLLAMERAIANSELHPGALEDVVIPMFRYKVSDIEKVAADVPELELKGVIESGETVRAAKRCAAPTKHYLRCTFLFFAFCSFL